MQSQTAPPQIGTLTPRNRGDASARVPKEHESDIMAIRSSKASSYKIIAKVNLQHTS